MHRSHLLAGLLVAGLALSATAVNAEVAPAVPTPPPVSKECGDYGAAGRPLRNSAAALRERKQLKILAIGSSSAAVLGLGPDGSPLLESILERAIKGLDVDIINRGFSGELADAAGERIKIEVALNRPDLVLWQVGTNDALAQVPVDSFEASVTATVRWLKEHKVDVILIGQHYAKSLAKDAHYQAIRMGLRRVAIAENVVRIGRYEAMEVLARTTTREQPALEDFGLTEAGFNCMAQYIARTISVGLFAKPTKPAPPSVSDPHR